MHRLDRAADGGIPRHHDDLDVGPVVADVVDEIEAADLRHLEIGHDEVDRRLVQDPQRGADVWRREHTVPTVHEVALQHLARVRGVVDDQDARARHAPSSRGVAPAPVGSRTLNRLPRPGAVSTAIVPP